MPQRRNSCRPLCGISHPNISEGSLMKALTLAALIAAAPVASLADSLTLAAPLAGGTVHAAGTDLSAQ